MTAWLCEIAILDELELLYVNGGQFPAHHLITITAVRSRTKRGILLKMCSQVQARRKQTCDKPPTSQLVGKCPSATQGRITLDNKIPNSRCHMIAQAQGSHVTHFISSASGGKLLDLHRLRASIRL